MASIKNILTFLALCAVLAVAYSQVSQGGPHSNQGGPHQNQNRVRRQVTQGEPQENQEPVAPNQDAQNEDEGDEPGQLPVWTSCNFTEVPRISCHDCNTRLICKPVGGLLRPCRGSFRPHCNRGVCSPVPSADCA